MRWGGPIAQGDAVARMLASVEQHFVTDFGLLAVAQGRGVFERPDASCFATSSPGAIGMICGTRHAEVDIRLERWDGPPPDEAEGWEDRDELPFEEVDGSGDALAFGFDPEEPPGLDLAGLGRARVRVLAWGRHRYRHTEADDDLGPERWLLQFWPDPARRDALAGPPRRIAGPLPFRPPLTAWQEAFRAWRQTGWSQLLSRLDAFAVFERKFSFVGEPVMAAALPAVAELEEDRPLIDGSGVGEDDTRQLLATLATAARLPQLMNVADLIVAVRRLGLLTTLDDGTDRVAPNPAPMPAWERLPLTSTMAQALQHQGLRADFDDIQWDLYHMISWAPAGVLCVRPGQVAVRLAVPAADALGGLRLLAAEGRIRTEMNLSAVAVDDLVEVSLPHL